MTPTPKPSSKSKLSLDFLLNSDHASRVAALNLDTDEDIRWRELVDKEWGTWNTDKLCTRWDALKAKVGASGTHRGE